jgi:regulator of sirC expression with transglutaminase-like and TPR domain
MWAMRRCRALRTAISDDGSLVASGPPSTKDSRGPEDPVSVEFGSPLRQPSRPQGSCGFASPDCSGFARSEDDYSIAAILGEHFFVRQFPTNVRHSKLPQELSPIQLFARSPTARHVNAQRRKDFVTPLAPSRGGHRADAPEQLAEDIRAVLFCPREESLTPSTTVAVMSNTPREQLGALAAKAGTELPLAEGALLIAAEEYPSLSLPQYFAVLDQLAAAARPRVPRGIGADEAVSGLCEFLFKESGFRGNAENYGDPKNSFLNEVLDRRLGIPVTLAVVYLEVGWRLGLPLYGVGMPAHFLVGCETGGSPLFVDAFTGMVLTDAGCERLFSRITGGSRQFRSDYLAPTPARYVLVRMLRNLKGIYLQQEDLQRAATAVERILLLAPDSITDVRDLGLIRYRQGKLVDARRLLEQYLVSVPKDADDRATIEMCLRDVRELLGRLN